MLCKGHPNGTFRDAQKTRNWTPLDPGVVENKYYAKGVRLVHEHDVKGASDTSDVVSVTPGLMEATGIDTLDPVVPWPAIYGERRGECRGGRGAFEVGNR